MLRKLIGFVLFGYDLFKRNSRIFSFFFTWKISYLFVFFLIFFLLIYNHYLVKKSNGNICLLRNLKGYLLLVLLRILNLWILVDLVGVLGYFRLLCYFRHINLVKILTYFLLIMNILIRGYCNLGFRFILIKKLLYFAINFIK